MFAIISGRFLTVSGRNGNVAVMSPETEGGAATDNMEVDTGANRGTSILSNPARFEALIRWVSGNN